MDRRRKWQTEVTLNKCLGPSSNTEKFLDTRPAPDGAVFPSVTLEVYDPSGCACVVLAGEMHCMGQEDHGRNRKRFSRPGLVSGAWRSFQASS